VVLQRRHECGVEPRRVTVVSAAGVGASPPCPPPPSPRPSAH
jgi:hypothetical protein